MSTLIKLRRSAVAGRVPTTAQLELGELAINTQDGKIFIKQYDSVSNTESIIEFSADPNDLLTLIKTVDGAGSGLDADLLDGLDSTQYLRSDVDDTFDANLTITGDLTVSGNTTYVNTETIQLSDNIITLNANFTGNTATQDAGIEVERGGETNVVLQWNETNNYWEIASGGTVGRILTTGDVGSGNGLDADLLDGQEGTYYLDWTNTTNKPDPKIDVVVTGDAEGSGNTTLTDVTDGTININLELTDTGVTPGTYGNASQIPVVTVDVDGRITALSNTAVAGVNATNWYSANNTYAIETGDGSTFNTVIDEFTGPFTVNGDIVVTGLVDGRDIALDGAKLDLLEDGLDLTLTGKVTGTASSNTGVMTLATELANTGVTPGVYGSSTAIPVFTVDEDGRLTTANTAAVSGVEDFFFVDANNTITLETGDGTIYLAHIDKLDRIEEDLTINLQGKVTGSVTSNTGTMTVQTELANTGVTPGTYGTASQIPVLTIDEDGRITSASNTAVAGVDATNWYSANNTFAIETGDGSVFNTVIDSFNDISANNISVSGTVDGRDIAADGLKLDGIESNATADQTAAEILTEIKSVDGAGSGLDADLLDGLHASDILAQAANTASSGVGNGLITITANNGLIGSGGFNLNDFSNTTIDIEHADTSSQPSILGSGGDVIQDVILDTYGHVTGLTQVDFDNRYYTETELDAGQLDNRYYTETELDAGQLDNRYYTETETNNLLDLKTDKTTQIIAGAGLTDGGPLSANVTISHADTSSVANVSVTGNDVIESLNFDTFGHVLSHTTKTLSFLTQAQADARYVNVTGDTMTGALTVSNTISLEAATFDSEEKLSIGTSQFTAYSFDATQYGGAEIIVVATLGTAKHISKLLITHDGSTAYATEFGEVTTGSVLATFDVTYNSGDVEFKITPSNSSYKTYKLQVTLIEI